MSLRAIASTTFFSYVPRRPTAPGSSPPWPGSIATVMRRDGVLRAGACRRLDRACVALGGAVRRRRTASTCRRARGRAAPSADRRQSRGYRSMTSRWPYSATGSSANTCGRISALRSSTTRRKPRAGWPTRIAAMYGSDGCTRAAELVELVAIARCARDRARAGPDRAARRADARSVSAASKMTRVYSCAGQSRADAIRDCIRPRGSGQPLRGGQQQPAKRAAPLDATRESASPAVRLRRAPSGIAHRPPYARSATSSRPSSAGAYASDNARSGSGSTRHRRVPAIRRCRRRRRGSTRTCRRNPIHSDSRTDKNQSDKSISSKSG